MGMRDKQIAILAITVFMLAMGEQSLAGEGYLGLGVGDQMKYTVTRVETAKYSKKGVPYKQRIESKWNVSLSVTNVNDGTTGLKIQFKPNSGSKSVQIGDKVINEPIELEVTEYEFSAVVGFGGYFEELKATAKTEKNHATLLAPGFLDGILFAINDGQVEKLHKRYVASSSASRIGLSDKGHIYTVTRKDSNVDLVSKDPGDPGEQSTIRKFTLSSRGFVVQSELSNILSTKELTVTESLKVQRDGAE